MGARDPSPLYLTSDQVAERYGMHPASVRRWRITGEGPPFIKLGGMVRYRRSDLERYEEELAAKD